MPVAASADDLEEIAEGKASARDKAEAGVHSARQARSLLQQHGHGAVTRTSHKAIKPSRPVKRRRINAVARGA